MSSEHNRGLSRRRLLQASLAAGLAARWLDSPAAAAAVAPAGDAPLIQKAIPSTGQKLPP
jgi:hypothetical protein